MKIIYFNGREVFNYRKVRLYYATYKWLIIASCLATILFFRLLGVI